MAKKPTKTDRRTTTTTTDSHDDTTPAERRDTSDRRQTDRRAAQQPVAEERRVTGRRKVQRRRQIDPTTCERDYSTEEVDFMHAIDQFKRDTGRNFPTCQDVLDVIGKLGYAKAGDGL